MKARVVGVHEIEAEEPVCLIELAIYDDLNIFMIDEITQEIADLPRMSWQAPYDEQILEHDDSHGRIAFFFHYLDQEKPLLTSFGPMPLPDRTGLPEHLSHIRYEKPC